MNTSEWCKLGHRHTSYVAVLESFKESHTPVFSLGFLEGQGGILTARSLEALIGKVIKISELKCVCLTYLYKGLARRNSYSSVSLSPPNISCLTLPFGVFGCVSYTAYTSYHCYLH